MLDTPVDLCQSDVITAPVPEFGTVEACRLVPENSQKSSFTHGGYRPGAGRKPKTIVYAPLDEPRWYCVRTEYGSEITADMTISTAGFQTFFPMIWIAPKMARRTELGRAIPAQSERLIPLLPRYIMARFDRSNPSWRHITTMRGVERIISASPERPTPIPDKEIEKLQQGLAPNGVLYPPAAVETVGAKKRWVDMATALLTFIGAE